MNSSNLFLFLVKIVYFYNLLENKKKIFYFFSVDLRISMLLSTLEYKVIIVKLPYR